MKVMDWTHQTFTLSHQTDLQFLNQKIILMKFVNSNMTVVPPMRKFKTRTNQFFHQNHFKLRMRTSIQISQTFKALKASLNKSSFLITDLVKFRFFNQNLPSMNSLEMSWKKIKSCKIKSLSF